MRRVVFALLGATALVLGSVRAVGAAPSEHASCAAVIFIQFAPGGAAVSEAAKEGGVGAEVGGRGDGFAPTKCP